MGVQDLGAMGLPFKVGESVMVFLRDWNPERHSDTSGEWFNRESIIGPITMAGTVGLTIVQEDGTGDTFIPWVAVSHVVPAGGASECGGTLAPND